MNPGSTHVITRSGRGCARLASSLRTGLGLAAGLFVASLFMTSLFMTSPADATLLVYEPFDYPDATVMDGTAATGQNLTGDYVGGAMVQQKLETTAPGLGYGSLIGAPPATGNRLNDVAGVTAAFGTVGLAQPIAVGPGDAIYWSALLQLDDRNNANRLATVAFVDAATGDEISFGEPAVGSGGLRVATSTSTSGGLVASGSDSAYVDGHTVLLVGRYLNAAAPGGDSLDLIVYDTANAITLPSFFDPTDPGADRAYAITGLDIDLAQINELAFTIRGTNDKAIDELRIGTTYTDVIPEPSTALLLALGLALTATHRRRSSPPRRTR